jgi:uncharacterized protein with von Willebrand factor type A (vWA) domain
MTDEERQKLCSYLRKTSGWEERLAADEIERLERELSSTLGLLYQESERRARLAKENKELRKNLHHLHSARETDMGTAE